MNIKAKKAAGEYDAETKEIYTRKTRHAEVGGALFSLMNVDWISVFAELYAMRAKVKGSRAVKIKRLKAQLLKLKGKTGAWAKLQTRWLNMKLGILTKQQAWLAAAKTKGFSFAKFMGVTLMLTDKLSTGFNKLRSIVMGGMQLPSMLLGKLVALPLRAVGKLLGLEGLKTRFANAKLIETDGVDGVRAFLSKNFGIGRKLTALKQKGHGRDLSEKDITRMNKYTEKFDNAVNKFVARFKGARFNKFQGFILQAVSFIDTIRALWSDWSLDPDDLQTVSVSAGGIEVKVIISPFGSPGGVSAWHQMKGTLGVKSASS